MSPVFGPDGEPVGFMNYNYAIENINKDREE